MTNNDLRSIAIIDDDEMILKIFKKRFEKKYRISAYQSPTEFLESIEKIKPDLFIVDWDMPEMDGIEVCKNIRKFSLFDMTPIAFYSGIDPTEENIKVAYQAGANLFIPKSLSKSFVDIQIDNLIVSSERRLQYLQNQKIMISVLKHNMASKLTGVTTGVEILSMHPAFEDEALKEEINAILESSNQIRSLFEDLNEILVFSHYEEMFENEIDITMVSMIVAKAEEFIKNNFRNRDIIFLADGQQKISCNSRSISRVIFYLSKFIDSLVPIGLPISIEISGKEPTEFSLFVEGNHKDIFEKNIRDMNDVRNVSSTQNHFFMHYAQNVLYLHNAMFSMIEKEGITGIRFAI